MVDVNLDDFVAVVVVGIGGGRVSIFSLFVVVEGVAAAVVVVVAAAVVVTSCGETWSAFVSVTTVTTTAVGSTTGSASAHT